MSSSGETAHPGPGRVRWRRFAVIMLPAMVLAGVLITLTAQSVLAVSFSISGTPFTVTANSLYGRGFEQLTVLDRSVISDLPGNNNQIVLEDDAIRSATISHLCLSVRVAGVNMIITAGDGSSAATGSDLQVDADRLSGNASFSHINIGQDASTVTEVPGVTGAAGGFAMQADTVSIDNLREHAYATTAGTFTLPGFGLHFGGSCP
ncbi:MAG TPA: DUF6230 family protein [Streptosporangiaceae bacterium]|nr:DUF6230 family protein [Streptosporangiaceae bacterium]